MRCEHLRAQPTAEKEMAAVSRHRVGDFGAGFETTDLNQGSGEAFRISGKLNRRGIREVFPLAGNRGFDEIAEEASDVADREQSNSCGEHDDGGTGTFPVSTRMHSAADTESENELTHEGEEKNPVEQCHEPDVQSHVTVENVGKFVCDDALKFIAGEGSCIPA